MGFWNELGERTEDAGERIGDKAGDFVEGTGDFLGGIGDLVEYGATEARDRVEETVRNQNSRMGIKDSDVYDKYQDDLRIAKLEGGDSGKMQEEFLSNQFFSNDKNVDSDVYNNFIEEQRLKAEQAEKEAAEQKAEDDQDRIKRIGERQARINEEKKEAFMNKLTQSNVYISAQASGNKYIQENTSVFVRNAKEKYDEMIWDGENTVGGFDRQYLDERLELVEEGLLAHTLSMIEYVGEGKSQDEAYDKATALHKAATKAGTAAARNIKTSQKLSVLRKDQANRSGWTLLSAVDLFSQGMVNQFEKITENFGSLEGYDENEHTATYLNQDGSNVGGWKKAGLMAGQLADEIVDGVPQLATTAITMAVGGKVVGTVGKVAKGGANVVLGKNISNKLSLIGKNYPKLMKWSGEMVEDSIYLDQAFYTLEGKSIDDEQRMEDFMLNLVINGGMSSFIKAPKTVLKSLNINDPKKYIEEIRKLDFTDIPQKYRDKMVSADATDMRTIMYSWAHDSLTGKITPKTGANLNGYNKATRDVISSKRKTVINQLDGNLNMKADRITLTKLAKAQTKVGKSKERTLDTLLLKTKKAIGAYDQNFKQQVNQNVLYDTGIDALYKNNLIQKKVYDDYMLSRNTLSKRANDILNSGMPEDAKLERINVLKDELVIKRNSLYQGAIERIPKDVNFQKIIEDGDVDFLLGSYALVKGEKNEADKFFFLNVLNNQKIEINSDGIEEILRNMNEVNIDLTIGNKGRVIGIDSATTVMTKEGNIDITNTFMLKADGTGSSYLDNTFLSSLVTDLKTAGIHSAKSEKIAESASIISISPKDLEDFKGKIKAGLDFKSQVNDNNLLTIKVLYGEQYTKKAAEFKAKIKEKKKLTKGQANKSKKKLEEESKRIRERQERSNQKAVQNMRKPSEYTEDTDKTVEDFINDKQEDKGIFSQDFNFYDTAHIDKAMKDLFPEEKIDTSIEDEVMKGGVKKERKETKAKVFKQKRLISNFVTEYQKVNTEVEEIMVDTLDQKVLDKVTLITREQQTRNGLVTITNNTLLKEIETVVNNSNNSDDLDKVVDAATITQLVIKSGGRLSKETGEGLQNILNQMPSTFKQDDIIIRILGDIINKGDVNAGHAFGKIVSGIVNDKSLTNYILTQNKYPTNFFKSVLVAAMVGTTATTNNLGMLRNIVEPMIKEGDNKGMREGLYNGTTSVSQVFKKYIDLTQLKKSKSDLIAAIGKIEGKGKSFLENYSKSKLPNKAINTLKALDIKINKLELPINTSKWVVDSTMDKLKQYLYIRAYITKDYDKENVDTYIESLSQLIKKNASKEWIGGAVMKFNINEGKIGFDNGGEITIGIEKAKGLLRGDAIESLLNHELNHLYFHNGAVTRANQLTFIVNKIKNVKGYKEIFENTQETSLGYSYVNDMINEGGMLGVLKKTFTKNYGSSGERMDFLLGAEVEEVINQVITHAKIGKTVHPRFKTHEELVAWGEQMINAFDNISLLYRNSTREEAISKIDKWINGELILKDMPEEQVKQKIIVDQKIKDKLIAEEREEALSKESKQIIKENKETAEKDLATGKSDRILALEAKETAKRKAAKEKAGKKYPDGKDNILGEFKFSDLIGEEKLDGEWNKLTNKLKTRGKNIIILGGDGESQNFSYVTALNHGMSRAAQNVNGELKEGIHTINTREYSNIIRRRRSDEPSDLEVNLGKFAVKALKDSTIIMSEINYNELIRKVYQEKNGLPIDIYYENEIARKIKLADQRSGKAAAELISEARFLELLLDDVRFSKSILEKDSDRLIVIDGLPGIYGTNPLKFDMTKKTNRTREYTTSDVNGTFDEFVSKVDVSQEVDKGSVRKNIFTATEDIGDATNTKYMTKVTKNIKDQAHKQVNQKGEGSLLNIQKNREAGTEHLYNVIKKGNNRQISLQGAGNALDSITKGRASKINGVLMDTLTPEEFNNVKIDLFDLMITDQDLQKIVETADPALPDRIVKMIMGTSTIKKNNRDKIDLFSLITTDKDLPKTTKTVLPDDSTKGVIDNNGKINGQKLIDMLSTLTLDEKRGFKGFSSMVESKYIMAVLNSLKNVNEKQWNIISDKLYKKSWDVTKKELVDGKYNVRILTDVMNKLYGRNKRTQDDVAKKYEDVSSGIDFGKMVANFTTTIQTVQKFGGMDEVTDLDRIDTIPFDPKYIEIVEIESPAGHALGGKILDEMDSLGFADITISTAEGTSKTAEFGQTKEYFGKGREGFNDSFGKDESKTQILETVKEVVQKIFEEKRLDFDEGLLNHLGQENPGYRTLSLVNTDILFRGVVGDNANSSLSKKVQDIVKSPTNSNKFGDYNFNVALNNLSNSENINRKLVTAAEIDINNILSNKEFSIGYSTGKYTGKGKATKVTNYDGEDVIYEYTGKKEQEILDIIKLSNNRNNIDSIGEKVDTKYLTMNIKINGEEVITKKYTKYNNGDNPILIDVKNRMIKALGGDTPATFDEALDIPFNSMSFQEVVNLYLERKINNSGILGRMDKINKDISLNIDNTQKKKVQLTMGNLGATIGLEKKVRDKLKKAEAQLNTAMVTGKGDVLIGKLKKNRDKLKKHLKDIGDRGEQIDLIKILLNGEKDSFTKNELTKLEKKAESGIDRLITSFEFEESDWVNGKFESVAIFPEIIEYRKWEGDGDINIIDGTFKVKEDFANKFDHGKVVEKFYHVDPFYLGSGSREYGVGDAGDQLTQYLNQFGKQGDFSEVMTGPNYQMVVKGVKPDGTEAYFKFQMDYDEYEYGISDIKEAQYLGDLTHGTSFKLSGSKDIEEYKEGLIAITKDKGEDVIPKKELKDLESIIEKSDEVGC